MKELVLAGMLLASRNLVPAIRFAEGLQGDDATLHKQAEEGKKQFAGIELPGRTLGIIGLGAIGRLVADAAIRLGMRVMGYDPEITVDAAWHLSAEVKKHRVSTSCCITVILSRCTYHYWKRLATSLISSECKT